MQRFIGILFVLWANILFGQTYGDYYQNAEGLKGDALKTALYNIIKGQTEYDYTSSTTDVWDMLKQTDKDPHNSDNVILIYSGASINAAQEYNNGNGWTREHVWAKSRGDFGTDPGPGTDAHHLRPANKNINSARNNRSFDNCIDCEEVLYNGNHTGSYIDVNRWTFEPRDAVKGDVARMIFYMATRYEGENGEPDLTLTENLPDKYDASPYHGRLSTLLEWNREDPVDDWERNRNEVIYTQFQHNRNPFIDLPELAEYIWGNAVNATWSSTFSTFPKNGQSDVPINTDIRFVFAKAIRNTDGSEITTDNIAQLLSLKENDDSGASLDFTASIDTDKKVITIQPNSALSYLHTYYASIQSVEDVDKKTIDYTGISFTTIDEDLIAPSFTSTPTLGDTDVDIYTKITFTFDEAIRNLDDSEITNDNVANLLTLKEGDAQGANVAFTATIDADKKIITATPTLALKNSQVYYTAISSVEDANNNASEAKNMTFTTHDETANSHLIISQYYEGISGSDKYIEITNMGNEAIDLSTYYLVRFRNTDSPAEDAVFDDGGALSGSIAAGQTLLYRDADAANPAYAVSNSIATTTATHFDGNDPIALLEGGTSWSSRVDCIYGDGIWGLDRSFYRKANINSGNKNKSILDGSGEWTEISCTNVDTANPESIEYLGTHTNGSTVLVDETAPVYTSSPVDGASSVSVNTLITLNFNEPIRNLDNSEITDANVSTLINLNETNTNGLSVDFTASINTDKKIITITPNTELLNNQIYHLSMASVEDASDNATQNSSFSFTTISADVQLPFWTLDFESEGGYSTSIDEFSDYVEDTPSSGYDYFTRTDGSNLGVDVSLTNRQGSYFFGAQDIDGEGATLPVELNIDDIDISGKTLGSFSVYLAADLAADGLFDWDKSDFVKFQYDVDNSGVFKDLFWINGDGSTYNSQASIDRNMDGIGDGVDYLTANFNNFATDFTIRGNLLDIKVIFSLNSGDEDIALDNFALTEASTTTATSDLVREKLNIYPNPSRGLFFIQLNNAFEKDTQIEVYNLIGLKVLETHTQDFKTQLDLREMTAGIYFVHVQNGKETLVTKIIKQ